VNKTNKLFFFYLSAKYVPQDEVQVMCMSRLAHPACYPVGIGAMFPGIKWLEHEADHIHQVLRLKICGAMFQLHLHGIMPS
jgi:hypothetical protein